MKRGSIALVALMMLVTAGLPAVAGDSEKGKNHQVTVELVSFDADAKTVTFKTDSGEEKTAPVQDKALAEFEKVNAGDMVVLTCHDNESGEHEVVTAVKPAEEKKA